MIDVDTARFTVGVFQDVAWAEKGLDALKRAGLPAESLSILAKESPDVAALMQKTLGAGGRAPRHHATSAPCSRAGPIVEALQGPARDLREARAVADDAARRFSGPRRPDFRGPDRSRRCARRDSQRAARGRRAGGPAVLRWRKCRDWRLDRSGLGDTPAHSSRATRPTRQARASRHCFCSCSPGTRAREYLKQPKFIPMAEITQPDAAHVDASAGHLSVHIPGAHPEEVQFLFEQRPQRLGYSFVASLVLQASVVGLLVILSRSGASDRRARCWCCRIRRAIRSSG